MKNHVWTLNRSNYEEKPFFLTEKAVLSMKESRSNSEGESCVDKSTELSVNAIRGVELKNGGNQQRHHPVVVHIVQVGIVAVDAKLEEGGIDKVTCVLLLYPFSDAISLSIMGCWEVFGKYPST